MTPHPQELRPFYFMATFWGATYREYFTDLLLASLLAPGNIPALRRERQSKFLIVTTRQDWDALQAHPLFQRLASFVEPIWFEMPVPGQEEPKMLVMSRAHRQMTAKAFQDRAYGVFLSPDLMLSNGSIRSMERLVANGKKVVLAVAIRFRHETMLAELEQLGYFRPGCALAVGSRNLMRVALRHLHSETLRYEFDAPWFAEYPISVYWWVRRGEGMIIHSFSWAPLVVDYAAVVHHDTRTFEKWTVDGDYLNRNFPDPGNIYVVTDSDEISVVSLTKESDFHFELEPYLQNRSRATVTWYKRQLIRTLFESDVMDPLKRHIFPTPVYLHAARISPTWRIAQMHASRIIRRACRPLTRRDKLITVLIAFAAPGLGVRLLGNFGGKPAFVLWVWRYRRFVWQRLKEKARLVPGRSRMDDGRDWVTPTLSVMNPVWSVRALLRHKVYRDAVKARLTYWFPFPVQVVWHWRYRRFLWQRLKEKTGLEQGRSRVDDGRDWVRPTVGPMNPVWSVRALLRDNRGAAARQLALSGGTATQRVEKGATMSRLETLRVKIFADGADLEGILKLSTNPLIKGFTTNPSLMRKAGITDYEVFARQVRAAVPDRPVSFEVFSDDFSEMICQGLALASLGPNVYVKIPVMNTRREFSGPVIRTLSAAGVRLNVTAVMTVDQVRCVVESLDAETPAIVSVFAGRIADTGVDPAAIMSEARKVLAARPKAELLWASSREVLNIFQADDLGCHIITVTNDILGRLSLVGKDLDEYSLETVEMFRRDAVAAGYAIVSSNVTGV